MKFSSRHSLFKVCPKTGRIVGVRAPRQLPLILLPAVGFLALVWFLIRVVPKPSRAAYPCQRVAAPLAGSFLLWLAGIAGASLAFHQARTRLRQARYAAAGLALLVAAAGIAWAALGQGLPAQAVPVAYTPHPANAPIGAAKGLMPGRVAWVHDPQVTDWDGVSTAAGQRWYDRIDQAEATDMMQWALTGYTDTATAGAAWDAIFRHFNGGAAYQPGEKVFIKVNLTTSNSPNCDLNSSYNWNPSTCGASWTSVGQSPQLMLALLDQLVNAAGVAQSDITIGDSTGLWVNELYNTLHGSLPQREVHGRPGRPGPHPEHEKHGAALLERARQRDCPQEPGLPPAGRGRRQVHDQLRHPQEPRARRHHRDGQEPFRLTQWRQRQPAKANHVELLRPAPPSAHAGRCQCVSRPNIGRWWT